MDEILSRAVQLVRLAGPKYLSLQGNTNHQRWKNISKGIIRMGTEEVSILLGVYPQYAVWLLTGEVVPQVEQLKPDFETPPENGSDS
ncbi:MULTISPECIES: DNA-binding protein [Pseudomonas]|uniref:DNA-binding protein n=1 Tax=Pseudomonas nitroreducens TaxID=46680 RepID=A0A246FF16_PSENT|nr:MULTISPECIES: DNA-binding protein [Pseudomonas]MDU4254762.1 DNA-binding protein [Pseudomonas sp.]OWP52899.1 DNA-binding protein [Pseudomonas nitroreducens]